MKVLIITTHLNIGGISTYTVSLAKALKAKGKEVFVVSSGGVLAPKLTEAGISHIQLDLMTKSELSPKMIRAVFEINKIIRRLGIDIIHAQTRVTQVIAFFASKLSKKKVVTTCHGFFRPNLGRSLLPAWGSRVIAISDAVREHLIKDFRVGEDKVSLIYNGIDVKKFIKDYSEEERDSLKDRFGVRKDHNIIGTMARFTPDKGHDVLLYALYEILKHKPNVQLLFVGDGKERTKMVELTQRLDLEDNVIFVKSQINTAAVLSIMDVFMFTPRRREGLGIAPLEAFASGKPVVATNVGGVASIVKDGVNGFLVEPSRPKLLVEPTLKLLKDKELYKKMSQTGRELVIQKFSINGMADRVEAIYKDLLETKL